MGLRGVIWKRWIYHFRKSTTATNWTMSKCYSVNSSGHLKLTSNDFISPINFSPIRFRGRRLH